MGATGHTPTQLQAERPSSPETRDPAAAAIRPGSTAAPEGNRMLAAGVGLQPQKEVPSGGTFSAEAAHCSLKARAAGARGACAQHSYVRTLFLRSAPR